jgi:hypothetical protein
VGGRLQQWELFRPAVAESPETAAP